ncbi:MAG: 4Fe-4S binding protein [Pirellulales bacterium]|nr:4Fe-4S binding protein [Pirellulales bacterium]
MNVRRGIQILFLLVFIAGVVWTRPVPGVEPNPILKLWFFLDPLIFLATWLAAHAVPAAAMLALILVVFTLILGRVFCGWICPFGTIHDLAGHCFGGWQRNPKSREHWSPRQRIKYYLLIGFLVMAVFGGHWVTLIDPLVLLYRTTTVALLPGLQWAVEEGSTAAFQSDPGVGPLRLTAVTEPVYEFFRDHVFTKPNQAFLGSGLIAIVFLVLVALNGYRRRFWCRYLCPLGALLGLFARWPLLRRKTDQATCNQCDLCGAGCHGAATAAPGSAWIPSECMGCLNCTDACNRGGLTFQFVAPWSREPPREGLGISRRTALGAAAGGIVGLALVRTTPQARGQRYHAKLIRPPGSRPESEFLARCTGCGLCLKICPTGALQPALLEAGLEGLWTPRLVPQIGYCDYTCNLCGQICPTGAIEPFPLEIKQQTKIGLAAFDTTRCIPYAYGRDCMVCEEHCPVPDKAIYFLEVDVLDRHGAPAKIKQPRIDADLCIGCGVCENVCPLKDLPGVRVFSGNETRHPDNQPILPASDLPY